MYVGGSQNASTIQHIYSTYIFISVLRKSLYFAQVKVTDEACSKDLFTWKINNHIKANIEIVGRIMNNFKQKSEKHLTQ